VHRPAYSPRSSSTPMGYTITPLTPHTGAEVRGIDLNEGVDAETRATLNRAFAEHHVLMVRGQQFTPPHLREVLGLAGIPFRDGETWIAESLAVPLCRQAITLDLGGSGSPVRTCQPRLHRLQTPVRDTTRRDW